MAIEIKVPDIGADEVEITEILVKVGDKVEAEQSLITVEGDCSASTLSYHPERRRSAARRWSQPHSVADYPELYLLRPGLRLRSCCHHA